MAKLPSKGDEQLIDTLIQLRAEAERHKKKVVSRGRWKECERSYANQNYLGVAHQDWQATNDAPLTWEAIERTVPMLTDSKPKLMLTGRGPEDATAIENLQIGIEQEMDKQQFLMLLPRAAREAFKIGTSFLLTRIELKGIKVKFVTEHVSAWDVFWDPMATNDLDLSHIWIRRRLRASRLLQLYPQHAKAILDRIAGADGPLDPRVRLSTLDEGISPTPHWGETTSDTGETVVQEITRGDGTGQKAGEFVEVWEGYFLDGDQLDIEVQLADGSLDILPEEKYPGGRIVTMIGDLILDDMETPFAHQMIPLTRIVCYDQPGRYDGQSFIEALLDPHRTVSMIDNKIMDQLTLAGDPERLVDDDSGVDVEHDFSAPGKVVTVKPGSRYEWRDAPAMPQYVWMLREAKVQEFNNAYGMNDISKGNVGSLEDTSGKAIEALQEPNNTRIRLIQRNLEATVSRWGKQTVANMIQFRTLEDWLRSLPPGTTILGWEEWTDDDIRDWPDVVMTVGSSLPVNKAARRNEYIMLYREGILGEPGSPEAAAMVLDAIDIPNKDQAVANVQAAWQRRMMMEQQQMMMQQAQAMAGAAPNGNGGPPDKAPGGAFLDKAAGAEPDAEEAFQDEVRIEQGAG